MMKAPAKKKLRLKSITEGGTLQNVRRTATDFEATLRALRREGVVISSADRDAGDIWLGLLHGPDVWCRLGVHLHDDDIVVSMRAFAQEEALGYLRWCYADLIDDHVEIGPQQTDGYGLYYSDLTRRFSGVIEMSRWARDMLDSALDSGLEFSARFGADYSTLSLAV